MLAYVNYFSVLSQVITSSIYTKNSGEKMNSKKSDFVSVSVVINSFFLDY